MERGGKCRPKLRLDKEGPENFLGLTTRTRDDSDAMSEVQMPLYEQGCLEQTQGEKPGGDGNSEVK